MEPPIAVSIIIPFYNGADFLDRCLKCATHQFTELSYEILLINDGSSDKSQEIASRWINDGYPILLTNTKNKGVSNARNIGIGLAKGEYVCFIDVDDLLRYYALEEIYKYAHSISLEMAVYGMKKMSETSALKFNNAPIFFDKKNLSSENKIINGYDYLKLTRGLIWEYACVWQYLFKRDTLMKSGTRFDCNLIYSEDLLFMWQILPNINRIGIVRADAYYYVQNPDSCLNSKDVERGKKKTDNMIYLAKKLNVSRSNMISDADNEINVIFSAMIEDLIYRYFISIQTSCNSLSRMNRIIAELQKLNLYPTGKYAKVSPYMPKGLKWKVYLKIINHRVLYLSALLLTNTIRKLSLHVKISRK